MGGLWAIFIRNHMGASSVIVRTPFFFYKTSSLNILLLVILSRINLLGRVRNMDMLLFFIGILLFFGSFIYLIVTLIKKTFTKKRFFTILISGLVLMIVGVSMGDPAPETAKQPKEEPKKAVETVAKPIEKEETPEEKVAREAKEEEEKAAAEEKAKDEAEAKAKAESVPREHKSALKKAEIYAKTMHMSKAGIYDQLTSEYGENFPAEAAQYAIDNIVYDWKENALKKAQTYAGMMSMSDSAIYDQLISEYGEKFTPEEAQYAIDNLE